MKRKTRGSNGGFIPRLSVSALEPQLFWRDFISKRQPAVFDSLIDDPDWKGHLWTNAYLAGKCNEEVVRVEVRQDGMRGFGRGVETSMPFSDFLTRLEKAYGGDFEYYMTTQELSYDEEGRPSLVSPPVQQLVGDFPWRPRIMGNLVLQNANLWFGTSSVPTSSGLHHDYHDNLYLLLRGRKTVTLYAPSELAGMYTHGTVREMHPNGRINYEGHPPTNADGSHSAAAILSAAACRLDCLGKELDDNYSIKKIRARSESEIEAEMDREMELILDHEMNEDDEDRDDDENEEQDEEKASTKQPPNFSRVDLSLPLTELRQQVPLFPIEPFATVELNKGQMLYLPAGWFHEVRSEGSVEGHLAFNYWFHPPDGNSFEQPYAKNFWLRDWESRS